jgi:hypothetical protein
MKTSDGLHRRSIVRPGPFAEDFAKETTMLHQFEPKKNLPSGRAGTTEIGSLTSLIDEIVKNGVPASRNAPPAPKRATDRRGSIARRKFTITDGPFAETKELIAGAVC